MSRGGQPTPMPVADYTGLRRYLPAVEAGLRALRERGDVLRSHFEPTAAELAVEAAGDLAELRDLIDAGGPGE